MIQNVRRDHSLLLPCASCAGRKRQQSKDASHAKGLASRPSTASRVHLLECDLLLLLFWWRGLRRTRRFGVQQEQEQQEPAYARSHTHSRSPVVAAAAAGFGGAIAGPKDGTLTPGLPEVADASPSPSSLALSSPQKTSLLTSSLASPSSSPALRHFVCQVSETRT